MLCCKIRTLVAQHKGAKRPSIIAHNDGHTRPITVCTAQCGAVSAYFWGCFVGSPKIDTSLCKLRTNAARHNTPSHLYIITQYNLRARPFPCAAHSTVRCHFNVISTHCCRSPQIPKSQQTHLLFEFAFLIPPLLLFAGPGGGIFTLLNRPRFCGCCCCSCSDGGGGNSFFSQVEGRG